MVEQPSCLFCLSAFSLSPAPLGAAVLPAHGLHGEGTPCAPLEASRSLELGRNNRGGCDRAARAVVALLQLHIRYINHPGKKVVNSFAQYWGICLKLILNERHFLAPKCTEEMRSQMICLPFPS